jgi:protein gp37
MTTAIEWTDRTWNPTVGCTLASPGCSHCYAMRMAGRLEAMGMAKYRGTTRSSGGQVKWSGTVRLDEAALLAPMSWRLPRRVFVNSMSDLFHEALGDEQVRRVWDVMTQTPQHTYQILTKRAERMQILSESLPTLPNVWLGTSVENADYLPRLDQLRRTRAAVRFVSFEPLVGSVGDPDMRGVHWAIVGGESGPGARPMRQSWVEAILEACRRHGAAFFFKQWGGRRKKSAGRQLRGRTFDEYPLTARADRLAGES